MLDYVDLLGKQFELNARGPDKYDCYGVVIEMYRRLGIKFPDQPTPGGLSKRVLDISTRLATGIFEVTSIPEKHTMVLFSLYPPYVTHVGFMLDKHRFIHILDKSQVSIERITSLEWSCKIKGFCKLK